LFYDDEKTFKTEIKPPFASSQMSRRLPHDKRSRSSISHGSFSATPASQDRHRSVGKVDTPERPYHR